MQIKLKFFHFKSKVDRFLSTVFILFFKFFFEFEEFFLLRKKKVVFICTKRSLEKIEKNFSFLFWYLESSFQAFPFSFFLFSKNFLKKFHFFKKFFESISCLRINTLFNSSRNMHNVSFLFSFSVFSIFSLLHLKILKRRKNLKKKI